jgi:hypothetical protein
MHPGVIYKYDPIKPHRALGLPAPPCPPPPPRASLTTRHPIPRSHRSHPCHRAAAVSSFLRSSNPRSMAPPSLPHLESPRCSSPNSLAIVVAGGADPILPSPIATTGAGVSGGSGDPLHHKTLLTPPPSIPPGSLITPDAAQLFHPVRKKTVKNCCSTVRGLLIFCCIVCCKLESLFLLIDYSCMGCLCSSCNVVCLLIATMCIL